ncbi:MULTISPECIES: GNAT family N-acetyltransferase [unclassified Brevibacterium]|uniref:GNAT family N-acetyltransferase n=1 Tax=unclassified Brevibacterium TaxID=2614124 RepID=UPI0010F9D134|nr:MULTISPECIES: GNAT family N-acetyltransferase [unclassified Brevibacterium]MCM1011720.1 GNAT family N-acetyltransferase [Brevibacterium sp. XM4083]
MPIRPLADGDDLRLNEVFSDAATPAGHMARSLFRPAAESPLLRSVIAEVVPEVPVGAAAIAESPLHPYRAWVNVEVAAEERGHGLGRELFEAVSAETAGTPLEGLDLRARVEAGSVGEKFAEALGFTPLTTTRVIKIPAGALPPSGGGRAEDLEIVSTGSVKLTKAFLEWYTAVNRDDAVAPLTIGQVSSAFLSEAAGAHGAAMLMSDSAAAGEGASGSGLSAFAVSYAREAEPAPVGGGQDAAANLPGNAEEEPATELILGSMFETREDVADASSEQFEAAVADAELLLARLSVDADVVIEVTSGMPVVSALADRLLAAGQAGELYRYETLSGPPADTV